ATCVGPLAVQFTYTGDAAIDFLWDFGDGTTSQEENPSHVFNTDGNYTIVLTVTELNGCEYTLTRNNGVQVGDIVPLFNSNGKEIVLFPEYFNLDEELISGGCSDTPVNFVDASTSPTQITSWTWDFGDGTPPVTTTTGTVDHLYAEGVYSPSLTIETVDGCTATYQCDECVKRGDRPMAEVEVIADSLGCCGFHGLFDAQTDTNSIDFIWYTVPTGDFWPFIKNDTTGGFPNDGDWLFGTEVPVPKCGGTTDMAMYTYNKGCADSTEVHDWQKSVPPIGTGEIWPEDACMSNWYPGMVLDMNDTILFNLNWNRHGDGTVDEVRITWDVTGGDTQCGFTIDTTYRVEDHGYWIEEENCDDPAQIVRKRTLLADSMRFYKKFPIITIPDCFQPRTDGEGYWAGLRVKDETGPAMCDCNVSGERFFITVFQPTAEITPSIREGCAPL
ncbi:MAG: PKD domain-containing protein, partial [Bacteroidota bacterium]